MPPATPKNSATSNRSAGEGRRLVRTGVRRETSVRPRARPRGRRRATRAWRQAKWRARDRSTALRPIPAERPSRMRQTNCRRGRHMLGHAPLALRYPPRAEVHTAAFRDAPASRALSGGVPLSVRERNKGQAVPRRTYACRPPDSIAGTPARRQKQPSRDVAPGADIFRGAGPTLEKKTDSALRGVHSPNRSDEPPLTLGAPRLIRVLALGELLDDLRAERRQVVGVAARD